MRKLTVPRQPDAGVCRLILQLGNNATFADAGGRRHELSDLPLLHGLHGCWPEPAGFDGGIAAKGVLRGTS